MTNRTVSLLMLFVVALAVSGVLLAMFVAAVDRTGGISGPWVAPVSTAICQVLLLSLGRRYILPEHVTRSTTRAVVTITSMVGLTLAAAVGVVWTLRWAIGLRAGLSTLTLVMWFGLLWWAVQRQQKWHAAAKTGVR